MFWRAIYKNGSILDQRRKDGALNKFSDIDRSKLSQFILLKENKPIIILHLDENKRLIYRRRVAISGNDSKIKETVYIVGWQERRNNTNFQAIFFVFEDGRIEFVDRFKENHPWFYPVIFMKEEEI